MKSTLAALLAAILLAACGAEQSPAPAPEAPAVTREAPSDPHSYANTDEVQVTHLGLDLTVDFDARRLSGTATLTLEPSGAPPRELVLDSRGLDIRSVAAGGDELSWSLGAADPVLGAPLTIALGPEMEPVTISYRTSPEASGLQWLTATQTAGRRHPFLFTQSQAIHARSWVPLQDTPAVRFVFEATIRTPAALRAVMGADNDTGPDDGEYHFAMPQPIPSYLLALSVGKLDFTPLSERTGIWAEPEVLPAAAAEFADTEAMMQAGEALFGPYRWGRYDLLILPPSFPFGGMENPRLSFITPTVIAGDQSLVALIAHELAHSWSGNLVTNATWDELWLNEGFTVYLEARIMEAIYGASRRAMEDVLGYQSLLEDLAKLKPADQHLKLELTGRDPDLGFTHVPYEKGRLLLVYLEHAFGREVFDAYLRGYFDRFAFKSLTTDEFVADLERHLLAKHPGVIDRERLVAWIHRPGLPRDAVLPQSDAFERVAAQAQAWLSGGLAAAALDTGAWTVHEWLYFLNNLPQLTSEQLAELDSEFALTASTNNEIAHSWLKIAIRHDYEPARERLSDYLIGIGRLKLIEPLYEALMEQPWGQEFAREVYRRARPGYHPLAVSTIDEIVIGRAATKP